MKLNINGRLVTVAAKHLVPGSTARIWAICAKPHFLAVILSCFFACTGCGTNTESTPNQRETSRDASSAEMAEEANALEQVTTQRTRPNILLISLDTVRADHLGCYGYKQDTTPNLDKLAAEGVRFEQCRTQATWTLPAHMSMFTSLLPSHHGVDNLNRILPRRVLLLTEILQQANYQTAALVNNGQMRAHWGFDRGFDLWQEFEVDTLAGSALNITDEALSWLQNARTDQPYFLFLHYYDAHDPYDSSEKFRQQFNVELSAQQCRELCFAHRTPESPPLSPKVLSQLTAAYDAGLAELDHELGRLLAEVNPETLIVIFSDHGEAFEEHGWMLHGATLYEEEVRVPLLMRLPKSVLAGKTVTDSTMLLDIGPTLLSFANLQPPQQFQGMNLRPTIEGKSLTPRYVCAESKALLEGRYTRSAVLGDYKAIWSLEDGSCELFHLPNEQIDIAAQDPKLAAVMKDRLLDWVNEESFWMIHANTTEIPAAALITVKLSAGSFGLFLPIGFDPERDSLEVSPQGDQITWHVSPANSEQKKSLLLEPTDPEAVLRFTIGSTEQAEKMPVFYGPESELASTAPLELSHELESLPAATSARFQATEPGIHIRRYQAATAKSEGGEFAPLDTETIRQLRSLGYLK